MILLFETTDSIVSIHYKSDTRSCDLEKYLLISYKIVRLLALKRVYVKTRYLQLSKVQLHMIRSWKGSLPRIILNVVCPLSLHRNSRSLCNTSVKNIETMAVSPDELSNCKIDFSCIEESLFSKSKCMI